jgi:hypothetical protein
MFSTFQTKSTFHKISNHCNNRKHSVAVILVAVYCYISFSTDVTGIIGLLGKKQHFSFWLIDRLEIELPVNDGYVTSQLDVSCCMLLIVTVSRYF